MRSMGSKKFKRSNVQYVQWVQKSSNVQKNVPVFCLESSRGLRVEETKSKILPQGRKVNFDSQDI
jgi:hypothetical protein